MSASRRQPSSSFPAIPLRDAVETIREVAKYGTEHPRNAFAQYLGHSTAYSGPFKSKLASFRDWNLVTTGPDVVALTPLAQRLAFPPDPERIHEDVGEAFRACEPFFELYTSCAKGQPLEQSTIANNAVHRLRVSPSAKDRFATSFIESVVYAGLGEKFGDGRVRLFAEPRHKYGGSEVHVREAPEPSNDVPLERVSLSAGRASTRLELPWQIQGGRVVVSVELDRPLPAQAFRHLTEVSTAVEALVSALEDRSSVEVDADPRSGDDEE